MKNCVYRFLNKNNEIIYIGKARDLRSRINNHNHLPKECYDETISIEYTECATEDDSLLLERYLIAKVKPKYNTVFRYNNISVNIEEFEYKIWRKFNVEDDIRYKYSTYEEELENKKIRNDYKYSDNKYINDFLRNEFLMRNKKYEEGKRIREEKYKLLEQKRNSMSRKEKELALKELIKKRKAC